MREWGSAQPEFQYSIIINVDVTESRISPGFTPAVGIFFGSGRSIFLNKI